MAIPDSALSLLRGAALGHVVTLEPDGSPQVTCVWLGVEGDEIVFASMGVWRKIANLRRDPRITISVEGSATNPMGLTEYLIVHGHATVTDGGAPELLQELAGIYLGSGVRFPPMDDPPGGHVVRITAERFGGVGPWAQ